MKKSILSLALVLALLLGSMPAGAATVKNNQVYWTGNQYLDEAWTGVNVSIIDGKKNMTKRLFKKQAYYATVSGEWIYFLKMDPDAEIIVGNIVRMKKDGSKLTEITKGNKAGKFFIQGQSIYYNAYDEKYNNNIYVSKLDGTGEKLLVKKISFWSYVIGKGLIYYVDTAGDSLLHSMKLDGTGIKTISTSPVNSSGGYQLFGDTLFFSEQGETTTKLYLVDSTGKNKVSFTSEASVSPIAYINQWFYFEEVKSKDGIDTTTLEKVKRDGTQKKTVAKLGTGDIFIGQLDTSIIYKTSSGKIYQIGLDGKITKPTN
jgi:hypothetical protein